MHRSEVQSHGMKASIIHVPKGFAADDWSHNYINFMPMGAYCVANAALARGHGVTVLNTAVFGGREAALARIFDELKGNDSQVVGIPLHWHFSTVDVMWVAKRIKETCPGIHVAIGGITASILGEEIMSACQAVDAIIHGDGEEPFCRYLEELERGHGADLARVPNLRWRAGGNIVFNGIGYVASHEQYSALDFGISRTVSDLRQYPNGPTMVDAVAGRMRDLGAEPIERKIFFLNLGRGCSYDCIHCAGSRSTFKRYFCRSAPVVRALASVLGTVADAYRIGFRRFHVCWDCAFPDREAYLLDLVRGIRAKTNGDVSLIFEAYIPPSRRFLALCSESLVETSVILSPNFFEYETMRRFMGYSYTLEELKAGVREVQSHRGCSPFVYFGITPLEDWSVAGQEQKVRTLAQLRRELGCRISAMPIYAEPGSPWAHLPDVFGIHTFPLTFDDFLREWRKPLAPWNDVLSGVTDTNQIMAAIEQSTGIDRLN